MHVCISPHQYKISRPGVSSAEIIAACICRGNMPELALPACSHRSAFMCYNYELVQGHASLHFNLSHSNLSHFSFFACIN